MLYRNDHLRATSGGSAAPVAVASTYRYRAFGTFRLLLAVMVLTSHTHVLAGDMLAFLGPLRLGTLGVLTFFVLSGYVIAEALAVFYSKRPGAFLANRALRIYPPFAVALVLSVVIHALLSFHGELLFYDPVVSERMFEPANIVGNALSTVVLHGLGRIGLSPEYSFVRYSWAVAIEIQFYLTMAALVFLSTGSRRYWVVVTSLFLLAGLIWIQPGVTGVFGSATIPYFVLGIALYHRQRLLVGVAACLVNLHAWLYFSASTGADVAACLLLLNLLILATARLSHVRLTDGLERWDAFLGNLTYPLYLNHYAVSVAMLTLFAAWVPSVPLFLGTCFLSLLVSYVAMLCTEPFTEHLRNRVRGRTL